MPRKDVSEAKEGIAEDFTVLGFFVLTGRRKKNVKIPKTPWVLPDLVTMGRGLISARPKAGKSYAAAQIADALHHQKPLWWCPAPARRWRVLYIMLDVPLETQLEQLEKIVPGSEFDLVHFNLKDYPDEMIARFPLNNPATRIRAKRIVDDKKPDYVIWDGLTFLDSSTNYNARESIMQLYENLDKVWPGPQLIIAHANQTREVEERHAVKRIMGSKTITADADWGIHIQSDPDDESKAEWKVWSRVIPLREEQMRRIPRDLPGDGSWIMAPKKPPPSKSGRPTRHSVVTPGALCYSKGNNARSCQPPSPRHPAAAA
jgi:hypothetical protein